MHTLGVGWVGKHRTAQLVLYRYVKILQLHTSATVAIINASFYFPHFHYIAYLIFNNKPCFTKKASSAQARYMSTY